jgi:hypothetical protein
MKTNVRIVLLKLNLGEIKRIKTTPVFETMFSKTQMNSLVEGKNILYLNMTAWGKVSRMFGENVKDITNE